MKKIFIILSALFLTGMAYAYRITCPYSDIDNKAKGTYVFNSTRFVYYEINDKTIDIEKYRTQLIKTNWVYIPNFEKNNESGISYEDFMQFDKKGNAYIIYEVFADSILKIVIFKYDPVNDKSYVYEVSETNPYGISFTVSDDGKYIFLYYLDESVNYKGYATVLAMSTENPEEQEVLLRGDWTSSGYKNVKNLCFDSNTKNLYFSYNDTPDNDKNINVLNSGFYTLSPVNGKYKKENLKRINTMKYYLPEDIIRLHTTNGVPDYKPVLAYIKNTCSPKYSPDEIYFSLKIFKDYPNYSVLYGTDKEGNPLTEEAALEYLYSSRDRINRLHDFCSLYCNSNDFEYDFACKIFPLEYFLYVKGTDESAYSINQDYLHSLYSVESGFLFSNDDGLWGLYRYDWVYSVIYHITDNKGNFIKRQNNRLKEIRLSGMYELNRENILIGNDYILFLPNDNKKIYCVKNDSVYDLSSYFNDTVLFNIEHLKQIRKDGVSSVIALTNKDAVSSEPDTTRMIIWLSIILLVLIAVITVLTIRMFYYKKNKNSIKELKKNKKFIFDIQEKERGRVSRDIHDSVIQDIRSIRLNSEMLNVTKDSEERKKQIIQIATDCIVNLRNICYNLTPAELATHVDGDNSKIELVSIIQTLVTQFIERTHVPCSIQIDESFSYPTFEKDVSQNLFRIVQEVLTNIEKHSYATQCSIFIRSKDNGKYMVIYISDDGIGCDMKTIMRKSRKNHFGLQNIKERASLIGAELEIKSNPGEGMETRIILPTNGMQV